MVRPAALYNKARFSRDFTFLGRVVAALCGNERIRLEDLTDAELSAYEELRNENDEMDKATAKEAKRKAEYRAAKLAAARKSQGQSDLREMSQGQIAQGEMSQGQIARPDQTNKQPTDRTTVLPTNKHNTTRSDPDRAYAYACAREAAKVGSGSGSVRCFDVYSMPDEELYGGTHDTLRLYRSAFGRGFWSQALRELGDDVMLEELGQFVHEVRAGEVPQNPGAAMTARLKARIAEKAGGKQKLGGEE